MRLGHFESVRLRELPDCRIISLGRSEDAGKFLRRQEMAVSRAMGVVKLRQQIAQLLPVAQRQAQGEIQFLCWRQVGQPARVGRQRGYETMQRLEWGRSDRQRKEQQAAGCLAKRLQKKSAHALLAIRPLIRPPCAQIWPKRPTSAPYLPLNSSCHRWNGEESFSELTS